MFPISTSAVENTSLMSRPDFCYHLIAHCPEAFAKTFNCFPDSFFSDHNSVKSILAVRQRSIADEVIESLGASDFCKFNEWIRFAIRF